MRVVIIANPAASGFTHSLVSDLISFCEPLTDGVDVKYTSESGHATTLAWSMPDSSAIVLAVGGDGTAREVVHGLADRAEPARMFIVPAGGANSCYKSFWGDIPWADALGAALAKPDAHTRLMDLARLKENGKLVLAGASAGFPPQAINTALARTDLVGRARYEKALFDVAEIYQPYRGQVIVDGAEIYNGRTMLVSIGGSRYRGGQFETLPHSIIDDGLLDVCVVEGRHQPTEMLRLTRAGAHVTLPGVHYARGRRVTVERTDGDPLWFEHDGEVLVDAGNRFTLDVVPRAVPMLVGAAADLGRRQGMAA
jgi:diacylglycerol kinase (ATP)